MKVWTNNEFNGQWPVGTAAVVVAETAEHAARLLSDELATMGLTQVVAPTSMELVPVHQPTVVILNDGDY